jgi:hypothetical protein
MAHIAHLSLLHRPGCALPSRTGMSDCRTVGGPGDEASEFVGGVEASPLCGLLGAQQDAESPGIQPILVAAALGFCCGSAP